MMSAWRHIVLLAAMCVAGCNAQPIPADAAITNVTAIDAVEGFRAGVDIVMDGDRVVAVGVGAAQLYEISTVVDGSGAFVIPGLWDAHIHLTYEDGVDHTVFFPLSIAHGVTYLRDTGGYLRDLAPARDLSESDPLAPDLYVSGPLLDGPPSVYLGQSPRTPALARTLKTPEQAIAAVDRLAGEGVHLIKAYEMLRPDVFAAINDRAQMHNLPVAAHVPLSMTAEEAARAGADDFQHLRNLELACAVSAERLHSERLELLSAASPNADGSALRSKIHAAQRGPAVSAQDPARCSGLLDVLRTEGVFQTPTMTVLTLMTRKLFADEDYRDSFALLPEAIAQSWRKRSAPFVKRQPREDALMYERWAKATVRALAAADVDIMAGTDAPIGWLIPGRSLHEELALLVSAGLTEEQTLAAATVIPAKFFGLEDTHGAIAPGMAADLVMLGANPLDDIRNTLKIRAVVRSGVVLDRDRLDSMMAEAQKESDDGEL